MKGNDDHTPNFKINSQVMQTLVEFAGKLILPATIIALFLMFKPTINRLLEQTDSAEFLGVNISFKNNPYGFNGKLSAKAIYYLINSSEPDKGVRYEDPAVKQAIDELKEKGLITWRLQEYPGNEKSMSGMWLFATPTNEGWKLLMSIGITPYQSSDPATNTNRQLLIRADIDWESAVDKMSAIGGTDAKGVTEPYANCYSTEAMCEVLLVTIKLPVQGLIIHTSHNIRSLTATLFEKKSFSHELIPTRQEQFICEKKGEKNYCHPKK